MGCSLQLPLFTIISSVAKKKKEGVEILINKGGKKVGRIDSANVFAVYWPCGEKGKKEAGM